MPGTEISPLSTLDHAMDVLGQRAPSFHVACALPEVTHTPLLVLPTRVLSQRGDALKAELGAFVVPQDGHYLFMATVNTESVRLLLRRNGVLRAEPLDKLPVLLVAGLLLVAGDVVTLAAVAVAGVLPAGVVVRWRGARA